MLPFRLLKMLWISLIPLTLSRTFWACPPLLLFRMRFWTSPQAQVPVRHLASQLLTLAIGSVSVRVPKQVITTVGGLASSESGRDSIPIPRRRLHGKQHVFWDPISQRKDVIIPLPATNLSVSHKPDQSPTWSCPVCGFEPLCVWEVFFLQNLAFQKGPSWNPQTCLRRWQNPWTYCFQCWFTGTCSGLVLSPLQTWSPPIVYGWAPPSHQTTYSGISP